ncbi:SecDF P1 head subdomain-containing protein [Demequina sp. SO4-13]|uniref:SecDF P1 head subdomain-containing protein n=1 Tax=Demequina sp. SO4-13 TaxID=3401027 RepID=UPI003AF5D4A7
MDARSTRAALAALTVTAATLLAACGSEESGGAATAAGATAAPAISSVEIRAVALAAPIADSSDPLRKDDVALGDMLADLGFDESPGTIEAAEWFAVGDCSAEPVSNADAAAGCLTDSSEAFLLGSRSLDDSHISGSDPVEEGELGDSLTIFLTDAGMEALADLTGDAVSKPAPANRIAIVVDGVVIAAPTVQERLTTGEVTVIGHPGDEGLQRLAGHLVTD